LAQLTALDSQILRLQEIKTHKTLDSTQSQQAFADSLVEDRETIQEVRDNLSRLCGETNPADEWMPETQTPTNKESPTDIHRHCAVTWEDVPPCPTTSDPEIVNQMSALWYFYSAAASSDPFSAIPATTFENLSVTPPVVHTLIGNRAWQSFWGGNRSHNCDITIYPLDHARHTKAALLSGVHYPSEIIRIGPFDGLLLSSRGPGASLFIIM